MGRAKHLDFEIVKKRARELRSKATPSETLLWKDTLFSGSRTEKFFNI